MAHYFIDMFVCGECKIAAAVCQCLCSVNLCEQCKNAHRGKCVAGRSQCYISLPTSFHQAPQANILHGATLFADLRKEVIDFQEKAEKQIKIIQDQLQQVVHVLRVTIEHYEAQSEYFPAEILNAMQYLVSETCQTYVTTVSSTLSGVKETIDFNFGPLDPFLFSIRKKSLRRFDCQQGRWVDKSLTLFPDSEAVEEIGAWDVMLLSERKLLHTGGGTLKDQATRIAQLIDVASGEVESVPDMLVARKDHTGLEVDGRVLIFGGKNRQGKLKKAEAFDLREKRWTDLGEMNKGRFHLTPVRHNSRILLAGGCDYSIEYYDLDDQQFHLLPIRLQKESATLTLFQSAARDSQVLSLNQQGWQLWSTDADCWSQWSEGFLHLTFYMAPKRIGSLFYVMDFEKVIERSLDMRRCREVPFEG